jgi:hypothetical protein
MVDLVQQYDFYRKRGDTIILPFNFLDSDLNNESVSAYKIKFTVRDEYEKVDTIIEKYWNSTIDKDGIITFADPEASSYNLTDENQIAVVLETDDTKNLRPDVYPYDVEFSKNVSGTIRYFTPIRGNLVIEPDMSRNA